MQNIYLNKFSIFYIEEEILESSKVQQIVKTWKPIKIIPIKDYNDVFQRRGGVFQIQKNAQQVILAKKKDNFIYKASYMVPQYDSESAYYNNQVMNCIYNCAYCYLQGMYLSPHLVIFTNTEDFFQPVTELTKNNNVYLCLSYDSDLLALESRLGFSQDWIEYTKSNPNLQIELRTKSAYTSHLVSQSPCERVIIAFSLSTEFQIQSSEEHTPSLNARLNAIQKWMENGWKVRICLDPILYEPDWRKNGEKFLNTLQAQIDWNKIDSINFGMFRMPKQIYNQFQLSGQDNNTMLFPFITKKGITGYPKEINELMLDFYEERITKFIPSDKITRIHPEDKIIS
jgi:spore photoproduct lyase